METINEFQAYNNNIKKTNSITLKSKLILSNKKIKYKKQYLHCDSIQNNNDTCEMTGISRINSINLINTTSNKRPKWRVSFAPKFKLINYIYYDPQEAIFKEENKNEKKNKIINEEIDKTKVNRDTDKVTSLCTCILI